MAVDSERLHKVLARLGWGSRRELERLIAERRIRVNGSIAEIGAQVRDGDRVQLDKKRPVRISLAHERPRVLAYHKPVGEVCSRDDPEGRPDVFRKLPPIKGGRWINIGRLDINTSGLLLFTNHGELAHRLMHPRFQIDREYAARIFGEVPPAMLERLRDGVEIEGEIYRFNDIVMRDGEAANRWYYCLVQSGRNREVRKLWESQGVQVNRLMRVRYGNIMLPTDLRPQRQVELGQPLVSELCRLVGLNPNGKRRGGERTHA